MRLTLTLDDELLAKAEEYTGISNKSALVRESLKKLVEREAARRLARLGGSEPQQADPAAADETWVIGPSTSAGGRVLPSSAPMSREYPATSAARIAARRRVWLMPSRPPPGAGPRGKARDARGSAGWCGPVSRPK